MNPVDLPKNITPDGIRKNMIGLNVGVLDVPIKDIQNE